MPRHKERLVPERLSRARSRKGLYQRELADLTGLSVKTISGYETGDFNASPRRVAVLADALGVSPGYLYGDGADDWPPVPADDRAHT